MSEFCHRALLYNMLDA